MEGDVEDMSMEGVKVHVEEISRAGIRCQLPSDVIVIVDCDGG